MSSRPYQTELKTKVRDAWAAGNRNVLMRLGTGGGKTHILSDLHAEEPAPSIVWAHRHELVSQLSGALADKGVRHKVIGSQDSIRACHAEHVRKFQTSFVDQQAKCAVASIDTLVLADGLDAWAAQVQLGTNDEAHHLVLGNKWSRGLDLFKHPNMRLLGPTATPSRADDKGLGRGHGGVFDIMVEGPPERWLIDQGYLTDYDMVCPTSDIALLETVGASGDYSSKQLREAAQRSHIIGDTVREYLRWARGRLTIIFATDVDTAVETTMKLREAGVRAETLTGKTDGGVRYQMLRKFERREVDVIVAVDIISEGFDLPAIECCLFARPTESLALFMQQFGRALRPFFAAGYDLDTQAGRLAAIAASCKPRALIIDLVANFMRFKGGPDKPRPWTLMGSGRRSSQGGIPVTICTNPVCVRPFERFYTECPYCGWAVEPAAGGRSTPQAVDGDVALMSPELLAALRLDISRAEMPVHEARMDAFARHMPAEGINAHVRRHHAAMEARAQLWDAMGHWGGSQLAKGRADREMQKLFWFTFGVDVLTARALDAADAAALTQRIREAL